MNIPIYSICVSNYNMGDTIEKAMSSVLDQLDDRFEVLVVDDGSTDDSLLKMKMLAEKYANFIYLPLERDPNRKLGENWNYCIRQSKGKYVLLHVDTDDEWEPYILDFVTIFHKIEKCVNKNFLLMGQQLMIANKDFLITYGPYKNIARAQDRDMIRRIAANDDLIPLDHMVFRTRMLRPSKIQFFKSLRDMWLRIIFDMRTVSHAENYILSCLKSIFINKTKNFSFKVRVLRALMVFPAFFVSKKYEPLMYPDNMATHNDFAKYFEENRGSFSEIMRRHGCDPDLSFLCKEAQQIFKTKEGI